MKRICFPLFLFVALFFCNTAFAADLAGGILFITPESGSYEIGAPFDVRVMANTDGQDVNAVEAEIAYVPTNLAVENISIDHSVLTTWSTPPSYDSATGLIKFSGWADSKFKGTKGLIITMTLRPLKVGISTLNFNSGAMLASDGHGSNIITSMKSSSINAQPQQIAAPPPIQNQNASATAPTLASTTSDSVATPHPAPPSKIPDTSQASAIALSGFEFAPVAVLFVAALVLIAFCIAYVLHRFVR